MKFSLTKNLNRSILACICLLGTASLAHAAKTVVITTGSTAIMGGFAGDTKPKVEIRSNTFTHEGYVTDWKKFEEAIGQVYQKLGVNSADHPLLMTQNALGKMRERVNMTQLVFDKFNVPAFFTHTKAIFSAYGIGRMDNTLVVHSEYDITNVVPIYGGKPMTSAIQQVELGTKDIDEKKPADPLFAIIIDPSPVGKKDRGIGEAAQDSLKEIDNSRGIREPFYHDILLVGEGTLYPDAGGKMYPGDAQAVMTARVREAAHGKEVTVHAPEDRRILPWKGASKMVKDGHLDNYWMSRAEYDKFGAEHIHKKRW